MGTSAEEAGNCLLKRCATMRPLLGGAESRSGPGYRADGIRLGGGNRNVSGDTIRQLIGLTTGHGSTIVECMCNHYHVLNRVIIVNHESVDIGLSCL